MSTKKKAAPKDKPGEPVVTMTVEVREKQVSVITTYRGKSVPYVMNKTEPGVWKGTVKADETTKLFEEMFPDCSVDEIEDIVRDLSSKGMDMHRELLLGERW